MYCDLTNKNEELTKLVNFIYNFTNKIVQHTREISNDLKYVEHTERYLNQIKNKLNKLVII